MDSTIFVATASQGVIRSADNGKTWHRTGLGQAIEFDGVVRSLDVDSENSSVIYAGADVGLCRSDDGGSTWVRVDSPFNGETVWKVAVDPANNQRIFVGTGAPSRAVLWRTQDGGKTWDHADIDIPEFCAGVNRPRLLAFAFNPVDSNKAWFGLEEGGLFRTVDGGDNWERVDDRLLWDFKSDVHAIQVLADAEQTVVVVCVNAVYVSKDGGDTWTGMLPKTEFGLYYARVLTAVPGSADTLFLSISDGTPGTQGKILKSVDGAVSWQETEIKEPLESCIWGIGVNPANSEQLVAGTKYGSLYVSSDAGNTWEKQWRSFPEIADVMVLPIKAGIEAAHKSDIA